MEISLWTHTVKQRKQTLPCCPLAQRTPGDLWSSLRWKNILLVSVGKEGTKTGRDRALFPCASVTKPIGKQKMKDLKKTNLISQQNISVCLFPADLQLLIGTPTFFERQ